MSFDYEYKAEQLEEYVRTNMGDFTRINLSILLLSLVNGSDHIEHIRDWMNEYTKEESNE
jgi:hypothetical protein